MDITALYNISSGAIKETTGQSIAGSSVIRTPESEEFGSIFICSNGEPEYDKCIFVRCGK